MTVDSCPYLFVYGTLLDENNPYGAFLKENAVFAGNGLFTGDIYDLGEYPGVVMLPENTGRFVKGSVYKLNTVAAVLNELDYYEGFGDAFSQPNEFIRRQVTVEMSGTACTCWIYLYNLPIRNAKLIASGDYLNR